MQKILRHENLSDIPSILSNAYGGDVLDAASATLPIRDHNELEVDTFGNIAGQKILILARGQELTIQSESIHYYRLDRVNFETFFDTSDVIDESIKTGTLWPSWYINAVEKIYEPIISYRNPEKVRNFLALYPDIVKMIKECWPDLIKYFGESVSIVLEVMVHGEEDVYEEIIAWIQSTDDIDDGLNKLDLFLDEWLEKQIATAKGAFNFNIEFKK